MATRLMGGKPLFRFGEDETPGRSFSDMKFRFGVDEDTSEPFRGNIYRGLQKDETSNPFANLANRIGKDQPTVEPEQNEPDFTATRELMGHLKSLPSREDYKPTGWQRFGAILAGAMSGGGAAGGLKTARGILDAPYQNDLQEWSNKTEALGTLSEMERRDAQNQTASLQAYRQLMRDDRTASIAEQRLNLDRDRFAYDQQKDIRTLEANGWKIERIGGRVMAVNPVNGKREDLGEDRASTIANKNANIAEINARTAQGQLGVARDRLQHDIADDNTDNQLARDRLDFDKTKPGDTPTPPRPQRISPDDQVKAEVYSANEIIREHPEWKQFVDDEGKIKPPSDGWFGPADTAQFKLFMDEVKKRSNGMLERSFIPGTVLDIKDLPPG